MNNILIRKANLDDVNIIQHLNNELFKLEKESFAKTLKALEKRDYCQRARDGDRIIWVKKPVKLDE